MKYFISSLLLLYSIVSFSQVKGVIVEKVTNKPVPYANIWVENQQVGISSEEDGTFAIDKTDLSGNFLVISAVGFQRQRVKIVDNLYQISLTPVSYQLSEVVINPNGKKKEVNTFKSNTGSYQTTSPGMLARYFPYSPEYQDTPYLDNIIFEIVSRGQPSKYRIRVFSVDEKGLPGNDLIPDQLIGSTKYSKVTYEQKVDLNLQKYHIKIPENGFYIAFEFITLKKRNHAFQKVGIRFQTVKDRTDTWSYWGGNWHNGAVSDGSFPELEVGFTLTE